MNFLSRSHLCLCALAATLAARGAIASPVSLEETYRSALATSESVKVAQSLQTQAQEGSVQARGSLFPRITASMQAGRTDTLSEARATAKLSATQPLFRGLAEYAGLRAAHDLEEAADLDLANSRTTLYRDVAAAYYDVLSAEQDRAHLKELARLTDERVKELQERERIGRSRRSEVLAARSREQAVEAEIRAADAQVMRAREQLNRSTGLPADAELVAPPPADAVRLKPLDEYLGRVESRADVRGRAKRFEAADEGVSAAWGAHFPSVDLGGNVYMGGRSLSLNQINTSGAQWDVTLGVSLPVFAGGSLQSEVRRSAARREQAEVELEGTRRSAATEIRTFHHDAELLGAELAARDRAVKSAEESLQTHRRDYTFGLATNLEVLDALNSAIDARRERDRTFYSLWTAVAALDAAAEQAPSPDKGPGPSPDKETKR